MRLPKHPYQDKIEQQTEKKDEFNWWSSIPYFVVGFVVAFCVVYFF